jgi:hypothetical protein
MNSLFKSAGFFAVVALTACGGGGGGGGTGGGGGGFTPPTASGDMVAFQGSRGWNYHGNAFGVNSVTVSVYADPPQNGLDVLVLFAQSGSLADAFSGTKLAGIAVQPSGGAYSVTAYVLLNNNGSIYAQGTLAGPPTLVPAALIQGQGFASYPGVTAVVQAVGAVPGASACPTPATGATVQYTFAGGTYLVSYVPGCGITQYVGNHGETLTLASVGSYPQLGSQSVRNMSTLTLFDNMKSLARILATGEKWTPGLR